MKKTAAMLLVIIGLVAFVSCETDPWEKVEKPSAEMYDWLTGAENSVSMAIRKNRDSFVSEEKETPEGYRVLVNTMDVDRIDCDGRVFSSIVMTLTTKPDHVEVYEYDAGFTDADGMEYDFRFWREIDGKTGETHLRALVNGKAYEDSLKEVDGLSKQMLDWLEGVESSVTMALRNNSESFVREEEQTPEGYDVQVDTMNVDRLECDGRIFSSIVMTRTSKPEHVEVYGYDAGFTDPDGMEYDFWFWREVDGKTGESHLWAFLNGKAYENSERDVKEPTAEMHGWLTGAENSVSMAIRKNSDSFVSEERETPEGYRVLVNTMDVERLDHEGRVFSSIVMTLTTKPEHVEVYEYDAGFTDPEGMEYHSWYRREIDHKTGDNHLWALVNGKVYEDSWIDVEKPSKQMLDWLDATYRTLNMVLMNDSDSFVSEKRETPEGYEMQVDTMNVDSLECEGRVFSSIAMKLIKKEANVEVSEYDTEFTDVDGTEYISWRWHQHDRKTGDNHLRALVNGRTYEASWIVAEKPSAEVLEGINDAKNAVTMAFSKNRSSFEKEKSTTPEGHEVTVNTMNVDSIECEGRVFREIVMKLTKKPGNVEVYEYDAVFTDRDGQIHMFWCLQQFDGNTANPVRASVDGKVYDDSLPAE